MEKEQFFKMQNCAIEEILTAEDIVRSKNTSNFYGIVHDNTRKKDTVLRRNDVRARRR